MNTITQRLVSGFAAVVATTITLGGTLALATPAHAEEVVQARAAVVGGIAAAQRYRAAQPAATVTLDLRAATTADVRTLSRQAEAAAGSNEAAFRPARSNEADFRPLRSNEADFRPLRSNEADFRPLRSNEAAFRQ